ncbi:hypothetical protein LRP67_16190 [Nocardioides sp. cx-169]|uniref:hypothetical protein n=1 Tax=Nocardioides sp. cx-169 TaxID=2899080 RepID=UPI001E2CC85C|nr:hypothetical protein [Nocardioides sp. cx-169]MCD4535633.1 hypothetical protein [Nocardioides sp. cx-169]
MFTRQASLGGDPMDSHLVRRFGYRGAALLMLGATWVLFSGSILIRPTEARPWVFHELIPIPIRAVMWITVGLVAIGYGLRGAEKDDTVGMVALMVMPLERFVSFAVSWIAYLATSAAHHFSPDVKVIGYEEGGYSALVWLLIVTLLRLVAGWPNPRRVLAVSSGDADV